MLSARQVVKLSLAPILRVVDIYRIDLAGARKVNITINHQSGGFGTHWSLCVADMEKKMTTKSWCVMG